MTTTLKISKTTDEPLFARKQVEAIADYDAATPSKQEVSKQLSVLFKTTPETIVIGQIEQHFGSRQAKIHAVCYNTLDDLKKTERKPKEKKAKTDAKEAKKTKK